MKRIFLLAISILMIFSFSVMASAQEEGVYENAGQLYEAWMRQGGVPDYISGVWSTDGGCVNLTFGVVQGEAGEKGRQEILTLVKNDTTVTIVYQTYSRNYLYQIQKEIEEVSFEKGLGLVAAGVLERENKLSFWVHVDYKDNVDTLAMIRQVTERYGDVVSFRYVDYYIEAVNGTQSSTPTNPILAVVNPQKQMMSFGFVMVLCVIVLVSFLLLQIQKRRVMAITTNGTSVVMDEKPITKREVEDAIRQSDIAPPEALDHRIAQSIE